MREIKFRAWDTRHNLFQKYDDEYISLDDGKCYEVTSSYDGIEKSELPYILSQYTGLKDKNGVEIYEGDIYHMGDPNITYTVVWNDTGLTGKQNGSSSYAGLSAWQERIEIISNIYEQK